MFLTAGVISQVSHSFNVMCFLCVIEFRVYSLGFVNTGFLRLDLSDMVYIVELVFIM